MMKNKDQIARDDGCGCDVSVSKKENQPDLETRIYIALHNAERVAVKLAQINQILKKERKKKRKKNKKLGKIDKKTGTLILKGQKKRKKAKLFKRHKKVAK